MAAVPFIAHTLAVRGRFPFDPAFGRCERGWPFAEA
jgi:hypothetical protein